MRFFLKLSGCFLVLAILLILGVGLAGANSHCHGGEPEHTLYRKIIDRYKGEFLGMFQEGVSDIVFFSDDFISMYENPCGNYSYAVSVISDPKKDEGQKLLSIISMQLLPAGSYFDFSAAALSSYRTGNLSLRALEYTFFPNLAYSSRHQWYFWYPRWRELNREAADLANNEYVTQGVREKLNGEIWLDWMDERASRGFTPSRR